jgi:cell division septation protein DedD
VRVAQGYITPQGALAFQAPCSVDETRLLHYDQAVAGCKYPLLVELPSKALYLRGLVMPSAPTQITTYLPFESELRDSNTPTAQVNGFTLYADSPIELRFLAQYVAGTMSGSVQQQAQAQPQQPQQQQPQQPQQTQPQTQPQPQPQPQTQQQAPAASSPFASALLLIGGVIAARYLQELE